MYMVWLLNESSCCIAPISVAARIPQYSHWQSFTEYFVPLIVIVGMSYVGRITKAIEVSQSVSD